MPKKILIFTDSRGHHRPTQSKHIVYPYLLERNSNLEVTKFVCPYKWTTLLDFLALANHVNLADFDHVVVHAGIVDQSPRPQSDAIERLYNPADGKENSEALSPKTDFSKNRIINRKKTTFDEVFGVANMNAHLTTAFPDKYNGQPTVNLYSIEMLKKHLVPRLREIPNLILINSNPFVRGWNGDYPRERPINIDIVSQYSRILANELSNVIDLSCWTDEEVMQRTCDNLHLSADGSRWIHDRILEAIGLKTRDYLLWPESVPENATPVPWPLRGGVGPALEDRIVLTEPAPTTTKEAASIRAELGLESDAAIATFIIGYRGRDGESSRDDNMQFLLSWLKKRYGDLFDVLVVEQDSEPRLDPQSLPHWVRYEFLFNPAAYNRGWVYNTAARHFSHNHVLVFADTDILPGDNLLQGVIDCHRDFTAVSPNRSLFYATEEQTRQARTEAKTSGFPVTEERLNNPTTLGGGMLVMQRQAFLDIGGFEQYLGYGCEDRALDVTLLALLPEDSVRMDSQAYFHQWHPKFQDENLHFKDIYHHLVRTYGCQYFRELEVEDYIHKKCNHRPMEVVRAAAEKRKPFVGDPNLYRDHHILTVNGLPPQLGETVIRVRKLSPVFPPDFKSLGAYRAREEFEGSVANAWAPAPPADQREPDVEELSFFYNRFKGERCFIIGNGPSLNDNNLDFLKNEYSFGVNSFYYKTRETGFTPTFYVVEDSSVIKENVEEIRNFEPPFKFFPTIYKKLHPKKDGTYFFRLNRGFYEKGGPNYAIPKFSTDITEKAYCGQSVTYINLQLAYFMGFTEVYLIGMDFNYSIPDSHKRNGDVLLSDTDDPNHFHKDYFGKGKTYKDPKLDRVLMNYKMANLVYECGGRKIYNATVGGKLELFQRVDYKSLFSGVNGAQRKPDLTRPPKPTVPPPAPKPSSKPAPVKPAPAKAAPPPTPPPSPAPEPSRIVDISRGSFCHLSNGHILSIEIQNRNGSVNTSAVIRCAQLAPTPTAYQGLRITNGEKVIAGTTSPGVIPDSWSVSSHLLPSTLSSCEFTMEFPSNHEREPPVSLEGTVDGSSWQPITPLNALPAAHDSNLAPALFECLEPLNIRQANNGVLFDYELIENSNGEHILRGWTLEDRITNAPDIRLRFNDGVIVPVRTGEDSPVLKHLNPAENSLTKLGFSASLPPLTQSISVAALQLRPPSPNPLGQNWKTIADILIERTPLWGKLRLIKSNKFARNR